MTTFEQFVIGETRRIQLEILDDVDEHTPEARELEYAHEPAFAEACRIAAQEDSDDDE